MLVQDTGRPTKAPTRRGRSQPRRLGVPRSAVPRAQHARAPRQPAGRALSRMSASFLRCRRYGQRGPESKSISTRFSERSRAGGKVVTGRKAAAGTLIRRGASMTGGRSRLPSFPNFSTLPRVSCRGRTTPGTGDGPTLTTVRPYPSAGAATSSSSIWPSTHAKGWPEASIITTPARMRWCRSAPPRTRSTRCWRGPHIGDGRRAAPQILITIAARFGRISWKYSSIAYALILKDAGILTQSLYPDAPEHAAWRMRDRDRQYRSVRKDDGDRIPRRGPGRPICSRSQRLSAGWFGRRDEISDRFALRPMQQPEYGALRILAMDNPSTARHFNRPIEDFAAARAPRASLPPRYRRC